MESSQYGDLNFKPAKANYTPVYMGMIALYSMKVTNYNIGANAGLNQGDLTLAIDPLIYFGTPLMSPSRRIDSLWNSNVATEAR